VRSVEAPHGFAGSGPSLFLAGGITGCQDWQGGLLSLLTALDMTALNPRRSTFDIADDSATVAQIEWEFHHLRRATAIVFWFPAESICPIALYELGAWTARHKPLIVGTDPRYPRRRDIIEQLRLARPDLTVLSTLEEVAAAVVRLFAPR
jgi:hypothetical protein